MDKKAPVTPEMLLAAGWKHFARSSFIELVGPLWVKDEGEDQQLGFLAEPKHANRNGVVHGGMLMSFADTALGYHTRGLLHGLRGVTIQFQMQFAAPVRIGEFVICRSELIRHSMTLIFLRGLLSVNDKTVASVEGVWKVLQHKPRT